MSDTRRDTRKRATAAEAVGLADECADLGTAAAASGAGASAPAGADAGAGGGARVVGGLLPTMDGALGISVVCSEGSQKGLPKKKAAPVVAIATELRVTARSAVWAAERAGAVRDKQGLLWLPEDKRGAMAGLIGTAPHLLGAACERAAEKWAPLKKGREVMRVGGIPGRNRVLWVERLSKGHRGERTTCVVKDVLDWHVGDELVAERTPYGWEVR